MRSVLFIQVPVYCDHGGEDRPIYRSAAQGFAIFQPHSKKMSGGCRGKLSVPEPIELRFAFWLHKHVVLINSQPFLPFLCDFFCILRKGKLHLGGCKLANCMISSAMVYATVHAFVPVIWWWSNKGSLLFKYHSCSHQYAMVVQPPYKCWWPLNHRLYFRQCDIITDNKNILAGPCVSQRKPHILTHYWAALLYLNMRTVMTLLHVLWYYEQCFWFRN